MISQPPPPKPNKSKLFIGGMLLLVLLGGVASFLFSEPKVAKKSPRKTDMVFVNLPPPPPPPPPLPKVEPPPPKDEPKPKEEMIEQEAVPDDEPPPEAPKNEAPPDESLGTNNQGNGPDMGLTRGGGAGGGNGKGNIGGGKGGSKWGFYASKIQATVTSALRSNASTRSAAFAMQVRVWLDENGRITRASLVGSSGNPAVDSAIKSQVLTGLQLPEAPPAGMPMPITLRITARQP